MYCPKRRNLTAIQASPEFLRTRGFISSWELVFKKILWSQHPLNPGLPCCMQLYTTSLPDEGSFRHILILLFIHLNEQMEANYSTCFAFSFILQLYNPIRILKITGSFSSDVIYHKQEETIAFVHGNRLHLGYYNLHRIQMCGIALFS